MEREINIIDESHFKFDNLPDRPEKPTNQEIADIITPKPQGVVADTAWTIYSPNERQIGMWQEYRTVEGQQVLMEKPVYEKEVSGITPVIQYIEFDVMNIASLSIERVVQMRGIFGDNSKGTAEINFSLHDSGVHSYIINNVLRIATTNRNYADPYTIQLRYTKTTDTWQTVTE